MVEEQSTYLVNPDSDPVLIRILGRASFQNAATINQFFERMLAQGKKHFVMDFKYCTTMDSTFLGILAKAAIALRNQPSPGSLVVCRLAERNAELIHNLGLHMLLQIDPDANAGQNCCNGEAEEIPADSALSTVTPGSEIEHARLVLSAHEALVDVNPENKGKFQDVITFLKAQLNSD